MSAFTMELCFMHGCIGLLHYPFEIVLVVYGCSDPRFILGILLFVAGYIINRWADWKLRSLRNLKGDPDHLPEELHGVLFCHTACFCFLPASFCHLICLDWCYMVKEMSSVKTLFV